MRVGEASEGVLGVWSLRGQPGGGDTKERCPPPPTPDCGAARAHTSPAQPSQLSVDAKKVQKRISGPRVGSDLQGQLLQPPCLLGPGLQRLPAKEAAAPSASLPLKTKL